MISFIWNTIEITYYSLQSVEMTLSFSDYMKLFSHFALWVVWCAIVLGVLHSVGIINLMPWSSVDTGDDGIVSWWFLYDMVWSDEDLDEISDTTPLLSWSVVWKDTWEVYTGTQDYTNDLVKTPYKADDLTPGVFKFLWINTDQHKLYAYKVKYGGNIGWVANKRASFSSWNIDFVWSTVQYVDSNGIIIATGESLGVNQIVFVEVTGTTN